MTKLAKPVEKIKPHTHKTLGPGFHVQADWAVIGVFALELLHASLFVAAPLLAAAVILGVFFGGGD